MSTLYCKYHLRTGPNRKWHTALLSCCSKAGLLREYNTCQASDVSRIRHVYNINYQSYIKIKHYILDFNAKSPCPTTCIRRISKICLIDLSSDKSVGITLGLMQYFRIAVIDFRITNKMGGWQHEREHSTVWLINADNRTLLPAVFLSAL